MLTFQMPALVWSAWYQIVKNTCLYEGFERFREVVNLAYFDHIW